MTDITVCIPVAPHHTYVLDRAVASVQAQTVPCNILYAVDDDQRGPGYIRNQLAIRVKTPYTVFLDADDTIEPTFAESTLKAFDGGYIYTDWYIDGKHRHAPNVPWVDGNFHLITTLLRTSDIIRVGGFDEHLRGMEDTDFYMKLNSNGVCGQRLAMPLVHYNKGDGVNRSQQIRDAGIIQTLRDEIRRRQYTMACCGQTHAVSIVNNPNINPDDDNVVEAMALWRGNRRVIGTSTGTQYPRISWPRRTYVYMADVQASPEKWKAMLYDEGPSKDELQQPITPDPITVIELGAAAYD